MQMAKYLDPKDPTPWFYDAIRKQTTNRPVEALQDMQKAIELNDNRAVYRSRLLLDSDLAARSASQGRIYSDLGFQQLALVEGWKSVNTDPTNFSAHRFLADSYSRSAAPRDRQSQRTAAIATAPAAQHDADSAALGREQSISRSAPAVRRRSRSTSSIHCLTATGLTFRPTAWRGQNNTYGGEGVFSGIYQKAAFSVGGFHFQTDGWRPNADQNDSIGNAFLQLELSPQTSVQGEYRYRDSKRGDVNLQFFPDNFFPGQRNNEERNIVRLGGRHAFSPNSIILGSYTFTLSDVSVVDNQFPRFPISSLSLNVRDERAFGTELQHLYRSPYFTLTTGAGYFDVNGAVKQIAGINFPPPPFGPGFLQSTATTNTITHHFNAYSYANINALKSLTFTLGVSFDSVTGDFPGEDQHQANPKVGVTWNPLPGTTVRAAAFKVLKENTRHGPNSRAYPSSRF